MFQVKFVEKLKIHILFLVTLFSANCAVNEIMWKNIVEPGGPQLTIWGMRIPCWIIKAVNINSEFVTLVAFPQEQWLHERASIVRLTYNPSRYK
jgi:hypothetical protein